MAWDRATQRVTGARSEVSTHPLKNYLPPLPAEVEQGYRDVFARTEEGERAGAMRSATSDDIIGLGGRVVAKDVAVHDVFSSDAIFPGI